MQVTFDTVSEFFPFAFSVDRQLRVEHMGKSLRKMCPHLKSGESLRDIVQLHRPAVPLNLEELAACSNEVIVILLKEVNVSLRGQLLDLDDRLIFLVTPAFHSTEHITEFGLNLSDFAIHDLTLENLFLRQHQQMHLDDHRRMVRRLRDALDERNRLRELEETLTADLAAAGDLLIRFDSDGRIHDFRCSRSEGLGIDDKKIVGMRIDDCFPELADCIWKSRQRIQETSTAIRLEWRASDSCIFETRITGTRQSHYLVVGNNVTERRKLEASLEHKSQHDPLTDLPNRELFFASSEHTARQKIPFGLLFVDIDNFKTINDLHGHHVGDAVLKHIADQIRSCVRAQDLPARLGGDEFGILLLDLESEFVAMDVAERLLESVRQPVEVEGREYTVTASIGVALSDGEIAADSLVFNADIAMYHAKSKSKNALARFEESMVAEFNERRSNYEQIRSAIENYEIVPYYQTIIDLETGDTVAVEALARWLHPKRGLLTPGDFIPSAEEADLVSSIGRHLLRMACHEVAHLNRATGQRIRVNVNACPTQFLLPDFIETVEDALEITGLPPELLCLEITERLVIEDIETVRKVLDRLISMGIKVALDDFGTGYSSLSHLEQLPISSIKMDQAFVRNVVNDDRRAALIDGIVRMAKCLNLDVVAEGIEDAAQAKMLREYGCQFGQGFLYSKAMHLPVLIDLVGRELKDAEPAASV